MERKEVIDMLWLWQSELSNLANDIQNQADYKDPTDQLDPIAVLKLKRVAREIPELLTDVKSSNGRYYFKPTKKGTTKNG